jgi:hypothetical protein
MEDFTENEDFFKFEFGIDFDIGDKVYADCNGMGIAGVLVSVDGNDAYVDFNGTYGVMKTSLDSVSPYDTT